jgi:malate dehydrogenase (oxaloacetate-decarboxylating)(NADP+)
VAKRLGFEPRVALLAYSTFGNPLGDRAEKVKEAVEILDRRKVDFEYDGEMNADVALNPAVMAAYPFCRLSGPANVLVMPARHSAAISTNMLQELGDATVIGPLLVGFDRPVQILPILGSRTRISRIWRRSRRIISAGEASRVRYFYCGYIFAS